MATTTNFGWTTPNDTDYVTQGAAAMRTLGNGIDTTLVDLKGGSTDEVLAKNSATDMDFKWVSVGGKLLSTTSLTGATVSITNISQAYTNLRVVVYGVDPANAGTGLQYRIAPNGVTNATDFLHINGSTITSGSDSYIRVGNISATSTDNIITFEINNYTSTTYNKTFTATGGFVDDGGTPRAVSGAGRFKSNSALTSLDFTMNSGNFTAGTVEIWGIK